jgi:integrase
MATERRAEAIWIESKEYWEIKVQKDGVRKSFRSSVVGRKGKHEAEAKADYWLMNGTAEMRFSAAWDEFLKWQKEHNGTSNYNKIESMGRLYILPGNSKRKLSAMKPAHWQACIDAGVGKGLSRRSCVNIRSTIAAFLHFCRRQRWEHVRLEDDDLHISNKAAPPKQKRILQDADINTLFSDPYMIKSCRKQVAHFIHAWRFFVATGLRRGELVGLRHEDIAGGMVHVRRNINAEKEETYGKNDNARRSFAITETMRRILDDQYALMEEKGIESPWVFPDWHGERTVPHALYSSWRAYAKQHNMECSIHELRHTFVSINKSDMPLDLLKAVIGHSSSMDTIGIYGHEVDGDKERAAQIMDRVIQNKLKSE